MFGALVAGRAGADGAEYRLAINVDVKDVRLNVRDLTEIVATKAGEYSRVTVIPDNRIQEAISEERASINQKCKAGQLDQKCQISLGGDLGATYWLQVSVVRGGKACTVRISCLSIAHGVQEASALESAPCDSDAVTKAIGAGLSKVSAKLGWGGAEAALAPDPASVGQEAEAQKARVAADKKAAASVPADMVLVPAGKFWFGCNEDVDRECEFDEKPGKAMELPAFLIDRTEVTVADFARCVEAGQCSRDGLSMPWYEGKAQADAAKYCNWGRPGREQHPINCLDWAQARDFCRFKDKRLPSAPEWEKAARGTDGRKYAWLEGPDPAGKAVRADALKARATANIAGSEDGFDGTSPVGSFPAGASPYGALDMVGNVWEWCENDHSAGKKVVRGGSWLDVPRGARVSRRGGVELLTRAGFIGVRCAQSVP